MMDDFISSCIAAAEYPKNLVCPNTYHHKLEAYVARLNEEDSRLFGSETRAKVDFWERDDRESGSRPYHLTIGSYAPSRLTQWESSLGFQLACIRNADDLRKQLGIAALPLGDDPPCRFVFVHAPHSRAKLNIARKMFMLLLTYHQVLPAFLDFLFSFGRKEYAHVFHFSGFRHECRLSDIDRGLEVPALKRSGRDLQLCYNLVSVEPSQSQPDWPWSVRQVAVYHSFDVETARACWIIIEAGELVKKRVMAATSSDDLSELASSGTTGQAFASTLATHLILCDWSCENWRWYIDFLEKFLKDKTRRTMAVWVDQSSGPVRVPTTSTSLTGPCMPSQVQAYSPGLASKKSLSQSYRSPMSPTSMFSFPQSMRELPPELPHQLTERRKTEDEREFSFNDLQQIQFIEEKANEALLIFDANANVLAELKQRYNDIMKSENCPDELRINCRDAMVRLERGIATMENDLRMQQSRVKALQRVVAERKSLLYGILNYENMEASKLLAKKAQLSADNVERINRDMHEIARKTKQETVSMRIVTLVTLFFLPGTFISTLMSTDIVRFHMTSTGKPEKTVQLGALWLFLSISLPLILGTFAAWYGVYWWVDRKEKRGSSGAASRSAV